MQADDRLWLVFRDEGLSLHSLMYAPMSQCQGAECHKDSPLLLEASQWWADMRNSSEVHCGATKQILLFCLHRFG